MKILILGAGAAGLFAAGAALRQGHRVTLLEHAPRPAQKILVTGKGRCNLTNACDVETFLANVRANPRFLYSSLSAFPPAAAMERFEGLGVALKTERGRRVFPVSDKAAEIREALLRWAEGAELRREETGALLLEPLPQGGKKDPALRCLGVRLASGEAVRADAVLIATGGVSYPGTGSTGDGYRLAKEAGHRIVPPVASLVSLYSPDPACREMMGLALRNVKLTLYGGEKAVYAEQGEVLFTHFGISGPLALTASSYLQERPARRWKAVLDLKPALTQEQLYDRLTRDFQLFAQKRVQGALAKLLPASMQPVALAKWGVEPSLHASEVTREQKRALVKLLKHWEIPISRRGDLEHAVITAGGVDVRQVDPATMESKLCRGLYFAGEVLDVDARTGGYNLHIAWCTAEAAARSWNQKGENR